MAEMFDVEDVVPSTPEELRRQEIEELKAGWASDPCFDIEDTAGFEDVREELLQFRKDTEAKWEELRMARLNKLAEMIGFKARELYEFGGKYSLDPLVFTEYMEKILGNISSLEDRLEQVEIKLDRIGRGR
jgi:hypothetical protein